MNANIDYMVLTNHSKPSPSNWYWMMLLKTSRRKNTRWWFWVEEYRNQLPEKASRRWRSLLAATMHRLFR